MSELEFHEIANIFPLITGVEFESLCEDIQNNGLQQPIVQYEGKILDGRNRYLALHETVGINPEFVEYQGDDPIGFVLSLNLHRRHLESDQRAAAAVDALPLYKAEAEARMLAGVADPSQKIDQGNSGKATQKAAEDFHTNRQYVSDLKKIKDEDPETFEQIKAGEKKLSVVNKERKKRERVEKIVEISAGNEELKSDKTYPVIYADPPWRYEFSKSDSRQIENQYPTMTLDEICALEIPAGDDAILFLWTTSPKLEDSFKVVKSWGFEYKTCAIWDKKKIGMGYYFRQQHEILLVCKKGDIPAPDPANRPGSVFLFEREEHSAKPHQVAEMIEAMYPEFSKLEMFCRSPRHGWDTWGNQSGT